MIVYLQATLPAASFQHPRGPDVAFWLQNYSVFAQVNKVATRVALGCTTARKVNHNSGLERTKRKVERSGPAPIVVELEQAINTVL